MSKAYDWTNKNLRVVEWISCKERMPETAGNYLIKMNQGEVRGPKTRKYSRRKWHYTKNDKRSDQYITHWMELPEGPE